MTNLGIEHNIQWERIDSQKKQYEKCFCFLLPWQSLEFLFKNSDRFGMKISAKPMLRWWQYNAKQH